MNELFQARDQEETLRQVHERLKQHAAPAVIIGDAVLKNIKISRSLSAAVDRTERACSSGKNQALTRS